MKSAALSSASSESLAKILKTSEVTGYEFSVAVNDLFYRDEIVGTRQLSQPTETGLDGV